MPDSRNLPADSPVATLMRWQDSGGVWRVLGRRGTQLTIGLFECTGGSEVDRIVSADPALRAFVGERGGSED
ncbi:hypothetical protein [Nocardia veterana]|uniref:Uncharacterized protein n=1 Tax=Nocardia veterana TaxID=132249 RepID=A0A7X6LVE5_9NOCA|nr:hypothetical protein [Nocardia veterana]NKY85318.1 hypothetical protein [Nocardia veterana]